MAKVWTHHRHQAVLRRSPSACLLPPFIFAILFFFSFFFFYPPHQEIYFSPMKLFRFPHKRSPMKIYMRSFRRWFIPKIRSIKRKILFILSSSFQQPIFWIFREILQAFLLLFFFFYLQFDRSNLWNVIIY